MSLHNRRKQSFELIDFVGSVPYWRKQSQRTFNFKALRADLDSLGAYFDKFNDKYLRQAKTAQAKKFTNINPSQHVIFYHKQVTDLLSRVYFLSCASNFKSHESLMAKTTTTTLAAFVSRNQATVHLRFVFYPTQVWTHSNDKWVMRCCFIFLVVQLDLTLHKLPETQIAFT